LAAANYKKGDRVDLFEDNIYKIFKIPHKFDTFFDFLKGQVIANYNLIFKGGEIYLF
jgi:hypothetical protein